MIAPAAARKRRARQMPAGDAETLAAPQYSAEAEKAVLGSMLARPDVVLDEVGDVLTREDFFVPAHQEIYEAITTLHNTGKAIDITTLHQHLADRKLAEVCGSPGILAELAAGLATHLNVGSYIAIVKDKALIRRLQHACADTVTDVAEGDMSIYELLSRAEARFFSLNESGAQSGEVVSMKEVVNRAVARMEMLSKRSNEMIGITTGIRKLDRNTLGFVGGEMIVLAARPGIGKTAMLLQWLRYAGKERWSDEANRFIEPGYPTGMFSLEMPDQQLAPRMLSSFTATNMQRIRSGKLYDDEWKKLRMLAPDLANYPIYFDFSGYLTLPMLCSRARRMKKNQKIELLAIDYLQLLHLDGKSRPEFRQNEVAEISRAIKALAKELDIPIIVLAQLNRKNEDKKEKPGIHNLRESGAIEQDADTIILLHKDEEAKTFSMLLPKCRQGPTDEFDLIVNRETQTFESFDETTQP